jgi:hypothetical protein
MKEMPEQMLNTGPRADVAVCQGEAGYWKRLDAGRNVETDVAIEDGW